jgi:hypothetical protein
VAASAYLTSYATKLSFGMLVDYIALTLDSRSKLQRAHESLRALIPTTRAGSLLNTNRTIATIRHTNGLEDTIGSVKKYSVPMARMRAVR